MCPCWINVFLLEKQNLTDPFEPLSVIPPISVRTGNVHLSSFLLSSNCFVLRSQTAHVWYFREGGDRFKVPSAHDIKRLGEVSRVKGMCHVRQRHMASETLSKNNQDPALCWAHFLPKDPTILLQPVCDPLTPDLQGSKVNIWQCRCIKWIFFTTASFLALRCFWLSDNCWILLCDGWHVIFRLHSVDSWIKLGVTFGPLLGPPVWLAPAPSDCNSLSAIAPAVKA